MFSPRTTEEIVAAQRAKEIGGGAFYNNPKYRGWIYQFLLLFFLVGFFYSIISNTLDNMAAQGIKSGFAFLSTASGFDILMSLVDYSATDSYTRVFIVGVLNTILVSIIGIFFSTILGFLFGIAYFSPNWLIKKISIIYVETFRNIPVILQVIFWYTAVLATLPGARNSLSLGEAIFLNVRGFYFPKLIGESGSTIVYGAIVVAIVAIIFIKKWAKKRQDLTGEQFPLFFTSIGLLLGLPLLALLVTGVPFTWEYPELKGFNFQGGVTVIPELMAMSIALSVYTGAFIAEAVRAGIQSVPHGQTEAARSIGMKENKIMSLIIVPQAMRVIAPMLNSEYQSLVKNSTVATAIGYPELFTVYAGSALNQVGQAIEMMFMTLAVYFFINMVISLTMNRFSNRTKIVTR